MQIAAVILAGGLGSRMGYRNKACLEWKGKYFYQQIGEILGQEGLPVWISAACGMWAYGREKYCGSKNKENSKCNKKNEYELKTLGNNMTPKMETGYREKENETKEQSKKDCRMGRRQERLAYPVIYDKYGRIGPIGGIVSAMEEIPAQAWLILSCDMPLVNGALIRNLCAAWQEEKIPVVAKTQRGEEPLAAIYTRECLPVLKDMIEKEDYRARGWMSRVKYRTLDLQECGIAQTCLYNVNEEKDYETLRCMAEK